MNRSFGSTPHRYNATDHMACLREIIVGGLEIAYEVGNYLRGEVHVGMSDVL